MTIIDLSTELGGAVGTGVAVVLLRHWVAVPLGLVAGWVLGFLFGVFCELLLGAWDRLGVRRRGTGE